MNAPRLQVAWPLDNAACPGLLGWSCQHVSWVFEQEMRFNPMIVLWAYLGLDVLCGRVIRMTPPLLCAFLIQVLHPPMRPSLRPTGLRWGYLRLGILTPHSPRTCLQFRLASPQKLTDMTKVDGYAAHTATPRKSASGRIA